MGAIQGNAACLICQDAFNEKLRMPFMNIAVNRTKPSIRCPRLKDVNLDDWEAIDLAFADANFAHFQQGWKEEEEFAFRPAKAAAAWTDKDLIIYAILADEDAHNEIHESEFNRMSIAHGDVFEIFLRPSGQDSYFEFHVNPNNQKFQLRFPCRDACKVLKDKFKSQEEMMDAFKLRTPIESRVKHSQGEWRVVAKIPFSMLVEGDPVNPGTEWRFSFSRYDYTRPCKDPVYSSTSPHSAINYHLLDEYGTLEFV